MILDLLVALDDVPQLKKVLGGRGYATAHGAPPFSFEMTDSEGHQVDVHPVRFTTTGDGIYEMTNGNQWIYPPGSLSATGAILDRTVRCQTPEMQMLAHTTGYTLDASHRADVSALSERFNLPLRALRST